LRLQNQAVTSFHLITKLNNKASIEEYKIFGYSMKQKFVKSLACKVGQTR